jgi:tetratricopeptide (TPR) repeat protein
MRRDAVAFALSGTLFGLLVGWMIGSQQGAAPSAPTTAVADTAGAPSTPAFSQERAAELERQAQARPDNGAVRAELGDLYFDAERFDQAIPWYEAALTLDSANADVSNNLALAYFATTEVDRALRQLERSLAIDPRNVKALFSQGIVRARGKQDLAGAAESWQRVVEIAPDSQEGRQAQQGLDAIRAAHATSKPPSGARESEP